MCVGFFLKFSNTEVNSEISFVMNITMEDYKNFFKTTKTGKNIKLLNELPHWGQDWPVNSSPSFMYFFNILLIPDFQETMVSPLKKKAAFKIMMLHNS